MCVFVNHFATIGHWRPINFVILGADFMEISSLIFLCWTENLSPRTDCAGLFSETVSMFKNLVCWPLAAIVENEKIIIMNK